MRVSALVSAAALLAGSAHALIPIQVKGSRFIRPALNSSDEGEVFQMVGVDYQPGGASAYDGSAESDVLTHEDACLRDAYVLQQLGVNTVRIYSVNPWLNHDACMSIFNAAGIYVVLDVNSPLGGESIARYDPSSSYNKGYLNRVFGLVDAFQGYPNLLGFFSGNEVVNDAESAKVSPVYMRAVTRDLKQYIKLHSNRTIPVGYSAADDIQLREAMWEYVQCGDDDSRADFYGLNSYQWCSGRDDWTSSGYQKLLDTFANTTIPIFLSEYGCNAVTPRTFDEVYDGVYGKLADVFSGGLVYEYSLEANNYGLVDIKSDGSVRLLDDFANLQTAYNKVKLDKQSESSVVNVTHPACNDALAKNIKAIDSSFNPSFELPDCPADDILKGGVGNNNKGKVVDLSNTQSQFDIYNIEGKAIANTSITVNPDNQINTPSGSDINNVDTSDKTDTIVESSAPATSSATSEAASTSSSSGGVYVAGVPASGAFGAVAGLVAMLL
ncbi:hypothetical protein DV495_001758 [Geotrichum candidum]|uniref:1,3-beta-glucanosyltransferase n=1 Tax=Geotrichum candidum TaxID=1173061 RepID=A0A0J9XH30_GEOCN|nr:hypothetical protein DV452_003029 [Geotrichum candidum]KAF5131944.1 hypothetical protein DV495_001758 [Geotrichum candidum]KAF7497493.1 hypothetical protein DV113_004459 [Geotrichum candidum]KAI9212805.1 hypothetical protein DS838_002301 [Geotrichum bryndzae]CDO56647.1 similar to Saccharomyces cerevisiae YOL132W GAS4 1,3-beta-glucanosyltransferase [Geotrichum candidum]